MEIIKNLEFSVKTINFLSFNFRQPVTACLWEQPPNQTAFVWRLIHVAQSLTLAVGSPPRSPSLSLCPSSNCMSNQCSLVQPSTETFSPHSAPAPFPPLRFGSFLTRHHYSTSPLLFLSPLCECAFMLISIPASSPCCFHSGLLTFCRLSSSVCSVPSLEMKITPAPLFPPVHLLACVCPFLR